MASTVTGTITRLSHNQLQLLLSGNASGIQLIDVRTPLEFDSEHIENSKNIPLDDLATRGGEIKKDCTTILICRTGSRADRAAALLAKYGMDAAVLTGGITDWKKAGLALKEGPKRLSLERQTQLAIGAILLSSVAAGWGLNRGWFVVPAFIGAGLTTAVSRC
jgi:rhodanese-related sulfurtransferase